MNARFQWSIVFLISTLAVASPFSRPVATRQASLYTIQDLGTLGGARTVALGLNRAGDAVGYSDLADGSRHAFVFKGVALVDLGTLGGRDSIANRIGDSGVIVGRAQTRSGVQHAFVTDGGPLVDLATLDASVAAATYSTATGVNGAGVVVGYRQSPGPHMAARTRIFQLEGGRIVDLGAFGGEDAVVSAINDAGQVAGFFSTDPHAEYAEHRAFVTVGPNAIELGHLGGRITTATDLNASGLVVGFGQTRSGEPHAFAYEAGTIRNLGTLPGGHQSFAYGVNGRGDIVGASTSANRSLRAVMYRNGVLTDLNTLIPAGSGWVLTEARDINDAGQIVGNGVFGGRQRGFLLTPRP
jgi:probable HAF family extracellular repeat protein